MVKLDKAMANSDWLQSFPSARAHFHEPIISDHSCIEVYLDQQFSTRPKPFNFFNCWAKHASFSETVARAWNSHVIGSPMFIVSKKLKLVKEALKIFNSTIFQPYLRADLNLESELREIQKKLLRPVDDPLLEVQEANLYHRLMKAKLLEEDNAQQKSCILRLEKGDLNTVFFHRKAKARRNINTITKLCREDGSWIEDPHQVIREIVSFYSNLLGPREVQICEANEEELAEIFERKVVDSHKANLVRILTPDEIKAVVFSIKDDKSPGPDGFTS